MLNVVLVIAASLVYGALALLSGHTSINQGLGPEGAAYSAMAIGRDLASASGADKLTPAFPLAAAIAFALTGSAIASFVSVNVIAFALLVFAASWILDLMEAPRRLKLAVVFTLPFLGLPSSTVAFAPGQPYLLGVALASLAVAASEWRSGIVTAVLQMSAVFASPAGIIAPLYGIFTHRRRRRMPVMLLVYVPALLIWVAVQYWARGGATGLMDLLRLSRVRADAAFWTETVFLLFGAYFVLTALGGLTVLAWSHPRRIRDAIVNKPELLALLVPLVPFVATAGLQVPAVLPYFLPFWFFALALWVRGEEGRLTSALVLAGVITLLTQHPWARITDTSYFQDWFPYSVHAGRVDVSDAGLTATWRLRMFVAAAGLAACAAWRRSSGKMV